MATTTANGKTRLKSSVGLKPEVRQKMVKLLSQTLADTFDLMSFAKQAHWNVKGQHFYGLHLLFDQIAEGMEKYVDSVAERITALGGYPRGTVRMTANATSLPEYPDKILRGMEHVEALSERFAQFSESLYKGIESSDEAGDPSTSDLLVEISRDVDQWLWFLEAHLQSPDAE